jgi:uncharacterized protein YbjT (DUF2867 family)
MKQVVVAGGTGYVGRALLEKLCVGGFDVQAIARAASVSKLPAGCGAIEGNVLDATTYEQRIPAGSTFVHLVGTPHPAPWKGAQFRSIDLVSLEQSVGAAKRAGVAHFIFVSVAHPAPVMKAYIEVRMLCERKIEESGMNATILRPWYVLGPGHYWPYALVPVYKIMESIPKTREVAIRLGLVTHRQMVNALAAAVASEGAGIRILETGAIRASGDRPSAEAGAAS